VAAALLGFGAGVTVAPALFMAGLSVQPRLVGRAFALVELLRLAGAYALVPAFTYFALAFGGDPPALSRGLHVVSWVILGGLVATVVVCTVLFFLGGARIHPPDLQAYVEEGREALESPPLAREDRPSVPAQLGSATRSALLLEDPQPPGGADGG
jgi:hypothetical protein